MLFDENDATGKFGRAKSEVHNAQVVDGTDGVGQQPN